jgi:inactive STAND
MLSMLDSKSLQYRINELEEKGNKLLLLIMELKQAYVYAMEPQRSHLKYEIEEATAQLEAVREQQAELQKEKLYNSLLHIDYFKHTDLFLKFKSSNHMGAFIICGSAECNQEYRGYSVRSLLKRLIQVIPNTTVTPLIERDLSSPIQSNSIGALWRHLASRVNLGADSRPEDIAVRVSKRLQTQHVILIFHGVNSEAQLQELIDDFWVPLVEGVNAVQTIPRLTKRSLLLMFLVDYDGCVHNTKVAFTGPTDANATWRPHVPIRLPVISKFSSQDLCEWVKQWFETLHDVLPDDLKFGEVEYRVQKILEKSNGGDPGLVMLHICSQCGFLLEGVEEWLKL